MLGTLIESRAVRQRHTAGSVASIVIHSVIITGGVIASARHMITPPPEPPLVPFVSYVDPVEHPMPTPSRRSGQTSELALTAPTLPVLNLSAIIPVGIPPVDLSATPTPIDFGHGQIRSAGILCDRDCAATTVSDAAGRQLWNSSDVMMRLLLDPVPPRYPESLRRAGVEGDVVVKFVVDTTGRVDLRTVEVMRSTHDAFTAAVRETLATLRFAPARDGERQVRALAVMPFHFTLK
jgi:protein TonB